MSLPEGVKRKVGKKSCERWTECNHLIAFPARRMSPEQASICPTQLTKSESWRLQLPPSSVVSLLGGSSLTVKSAFEDIIRRSKIAIGRKLPNTLERRWPLSLNE